MRPRLLDLFCGAGGAAMGYHRAGFDVVGVDHKPQKHFPFEFYQADALGFVAEHGREFDAIHASPPCHRFSIGTPKRTRCLHPDLIAATRNALLATGKPWVIENVPGAPLISPVMLCGSMFGLETRGGNQLRRHRLFEYSFPVGLTAPCNHKGGSVIGVYGHSQHSRRRRPATVGVYGHFDVEARREAMGIDWMTGAELSQAIPPAYTEWMGRHLLAALAHSPEEAHHERA